MYKRVISISKIQVGCHISTMKNNEKYTVGYFVLNPTANFYSDSIKSKRPRVVSANIHIK